MTTPRTSRTRFETWRLGVRLVLDDFGTGYSSLSYLRTIPFDKIKIDRAFVSAMDHDEPSEVIVSAIVNIGKALRLTVTAEGVETERQLDLVRSAGCDQVQGFLMGKPSTQVAPHIAQRRPVTHPQSGLETRT